MSDRVQFIRPTAAVLLACGLIVGLPPHFAAADPIEIEFHVAPRIKVVSRNNCWWNAAGEPVNHAMDFVSALYLLPQYFRDAT